MVQVSEAGSLMLRNSGSAFYGSVPPECDGRTITRLCLPEQGSTVLNVPNLLLINSAAVLDLDSLEIRVRDVKEARSAAATRTKSKGKM